MEEKAKETYIDLGKILKVVWDNIIWILLVTVVLGAGAYIITRITWKPVYTSEVQLYTVMRQEGEEQNEASVTTAQISIRRNVAVFYVKAIKKPDSLTLMCERLKEHGYDITRSKLSSMLSANVDSEASEIIHIKASTYEPELSYLICNIVGEEAGKLVENAYIGCTVDIFNRPQLPTKPESSKALRNAAIAAVVGFVVSAGIFIAIYMLDRSVKNGEELEQLSGVRYLGEVPDFNDVFKGGDKYGYRYAYERKSDSAG